MEEREKGIFTLPAVKFAPFLAAGMLLAYFCGSVFAWAIPLAAVGFTLTLAKKRAFSACFAGLLAGLALMTVHSEFYCKPIMSPKRK